MHRRNLRSWVAIVGLVLAAGVAASGCSGTSEEQLTIRKYFDASRMRDNVTLNNIATVSFRPQEEGIVQSFRIVSVSPEERRPLRIKELNAAYEAAKKEDEAFTQRKKEYQDKNLEAIDRVLRAERENRPLRGADLQVQKEWTKWREQTAEYAKKVSEARRAAADEAAVPELSVYDARNPIRVADYDGELITKRVTIDAEVRTPDNQVTRKQLQITMQRAELRGPGGDQRSGRWIITAIK
jgi:hypothetical protein